jgi:hypothetical protein
MAWLMVAGETLRCNRNTWRRLPDAVQGEMARGADGTLNTSQVYPKAIYEGTVVWLTTAAAEAFRVAVSVAGMPGVAKEVTAVSDSEGLLGGDSLQVYATLGQGEAVYYVVAGAPTIYWRYALRLEAA